jgi:8-oxo-dGTP pyrophosphatase MutT (NUDIX family)
METELPFGVVVVIEQGDEVLATSRRNDPDDLGFPGGKREPNETPEETARREAREETGVEVEELVPLCSGMDAHNHLVQAFLVTRWSGTPRPKEPGIWAGFVARDRLTSPRVSFPDFNGLCFRTLAAQRE